MRDLLASLVVFPLLVALGLAVLYALTVVPVLLSLAMAERRGFSTGRWAGLALLGVLLGLGLAAVAVRADAPRVLQVVPLALAFAAPLGLWLLQGTEAVGGRAGRHESPV